MANHLAQRVAGFGTSVFTEMSRLAVQHQAVNLGQGFPDFPGPDFVKEAAIQAIRADFNQYAVSHGTLRLRCAIAETWERVYGRGVDPETEVSIGSGATELLLDAILALVNPGDEVILFEPFYDSYVPDILMAGGSPRTITLQPPDWHFDRQALADLFTPRTRLVLINTPHNPTGKMFNREELAFVASLCRERDVLVVTDEVYEQIRFDGVEHVPIATLPGMWERTLTVNSTPPSTQIRPAPPSWPASASPRGRRRSGPPPRDCKGFGLPGRPDQPERHAFMSSRTTLVI